MRLIWRVKVSLVHVAVIKSVRQIAHALPQCIPIRLKPRILPPVYAKLPQIAQIRIDKVRFPERGQFSAIPAQQAMQQADLLPDLLIWQRIGQFLTFYIVK